MLTKLKEIIPTLTWKVCDSKKYIYAHFNDEIMFTALDNSEYKHPDTPVSIIFSVHSKLLNIAYDLQLKEEENAELVKLAYDKIRYDYNVFLNLFNKSIIEFVPNGNLDESIERAVLSLSSLNQTELSECIFKATGKKVSILELMEFFEFLPDAYQLCILKEDLFALKFRKKNIMLLKKNSVKWKMA